MENYRELPPLSANTNPTDEKLMIFFTGKLNSLHCAKSHLIERFQELATDDNFFSLPFRIDDTIEAAEKTIQRIDLVYNFIGKKYCYDECGELINVLEESFSAVQNNLDDAPLCCLHMINYLKKIEKTQTIAYELMKLAATKLKNRALLDVLGQVFEEGDNTLVLQLTDIVLN
jgi:ferritin-like metal-binding protein YciE